PSQTTDAPPREASAVEWARKQIGTLRTARLVDESRDGKDLKAMESAITRSLVCPTLIGRASERAALRLLLEQTKGGHGHVVMLTGEAGIGKTRLVREVQREALAQGFLLYQGVCFPTDRSCPYAPWLDLLRPLL